MSRKEPAMAVRVDAKSLATALKAVEHATGDKEARPILTCTLLSAVDGGLYAVAADNYRIAEARIDVIEGEPEALGERTTLLMPGERPVILAFLKSLWMGTCELAVVARQLTLTGGSTVLTVALMDGTFPDYRKSLKLDVTPPAVFAIHPEYMADAAKALSSETVVAVRAASPMSPVFFERDGYREIVMPVRTAETHVEPIPDAIPA